MGITLNPKKFQFAQESVNFAGYVISRDGVQADPKKVKAIAEFPTPKDIHDLRSFLGLVEQLAGFSSEISAKFDPMRSLLKKGNQFIWTNDHEEAFKEVKELITQAPVAGRGLLRYPSGTDEWGHTETKEGCPMTETCSKTVTTLL